MIWWLVLALVAGAAALFVAYLVAFWRGWSGVGKEARTWQ